MEVLSNFQTAAGKFLDNTDSTFESKVKKCLIWSKDDWNASGMSGSNFATLIASLKYWFNQLEEALSDKSLILTTFNVSKEAFVDLDDIIDSISELSTDIKVIGYNRFQNRRYLCLEFENSDMKTYVLDHLKMIKNDYVVFLDWVGQESFFCLKVQWLPTHIDSAKVKDALDKYVEIMEEEKIKTNLRRGQNIQSGDLKFKCKLLKNTSLNSIPHFCNIGKLKAFIIIPGRDQMCLTCYKTGHISYQCPTPFCKICKKLMPIKHVCNKLNTYADKLKSSLQFVNPSHHFDWGSEMEEDFASSESSKKCDTNLLSDGMQNGKDLQKHGQGYFKEASSASAQNALQETSGFLTTFSGLQNKIDNSLQLNTAIQISDSEKIAQSIPNLTEKCNMQKNNNIEYMDLAVVTNKRKMSGLSPSSSELELQIVRHQKNSKQILTYSKTQPKFNIPINLESIRLSKDRITTEQQFSDNSSTFDDEQQEQDPEVLSCVKSYFEELSALKLVKLPKLVSGGEIAGTEHSSFLGVERIDTKESTGKRKTETNAVNKKDKNTSKKENSKNNNIGTRRTH